MALSKILLRGCWGWLILSAIIAVWNNAAIAENLLIATREGASTPDPHWNTNPFNFQVNVNVYEPMIRLNEHGVVVPWLAETWDRPDDVTWIFHLRKNVRFHDGSPFTAEDVVFSYHRAGNLPRAPQSFKTYVRSIKTMDVVDANTLKITTDGPSPALLERLSYVLLVSKKNAENNSNEDYNNGKGVIGTGPYKWISWVPSDRVEFERNGDYWGGKEPWDRVTYKSIPADPSRLASLVSGETDVLQTVPSSDIARLKNDPRVSVWGKLTGRIAYISFNPDAPMEEGPAKLTGPNGEKLSENPLKNPLVRQALELALDREAFVKRIYQSEAEATAQFLLPSVNGSIPELKPQPGNPERARALLQQTGWHGKFKVELVVGSNFFPQSLPTAEAIAQSWSRVGVPTTVVQLAYPIYLDARAKGRIPVTVASYVNSTGSADAMFPLVLHSRETERGYGTLNYSPHKNGEVDRLIELAEKTGDVQARGKLYAEATRAVLADGLIVPLWFFYAVNASKKSLKVEARGDSQVLPQHIRPASVGAGSAATK